MEAVKIKNIKKSYQQQEVLKGITLSIQQGEVFTLLGENGAGKTTLINILATLIKPTAGEAEIMGQSIFSDQSAIREMISLNSQANTLDEEFSGYENLKLVAQLRGLKNSDAEIEKLSQRLEMQDFLKRRVAEYSGGMKRRLDIAMSLIGDPQILFLDEPTTGVDPKNRLEIWSIIEEIRAAGKTIFLTTQYLEEADRLSDHIAFIKDGKIALYGTPAEIKKNVEKRVALKVAEADKEKARKLLKEQGLLYKETAESWEIEEHSAQEVLKVLAEHQLTIESFGLIETNLETIFLDVTRKEEEK
ncbi:putative daunorubicin/doxorubicin resistance ATP-binding protein DrrA [Enterococcus faecalis 13-SD-W-01]|nr:putative daunorubicin/doxorubicin resistance ATP-binding protein DrrA [Enterococcus faecalis 13-SD-W-01]